MAKDLHEVRNEILQMHRRVHEETYYELLGVEPEADAAMVGAKFRELARTWHVDRFSGYDLGPDKTKVQEIFSVLNTAHRTLSHPDKRAEYDITISDGPDITDLLEAETHFRTGKNRLASGSYKGAHESFKAAMDLLTDDEPEYRAHLLYTEYLLIDKDEDGLVKNRQRTQKIFDELDEINMLIPDKHWLLTFLGTVSMGLDQNRRAMGLFQEALLANSQDHDAKRMLRLLRSRGQKSKKKGFFARLFGK